MTVADPAASPLRIAFVMLHTSPIDEPGTKDAGGMNVVVRAQAEELARLGHEVELITRRQDPGSPETTRLAPNLHLRILDAGPAETIEKGDHERYIDAFRDALEPTLAGLDIDIVHAEHWFSGIAALPVARRLGVPFVQSFHSIAAERTSPLSDGERAESPGRLAGEAMLAKEADSLVVISRAERDTAIHRLGAPPEHLAIVPPGVDSDLFRPAAGDRQGDEPVDEPTDGQVDGPAAADEPADRPIDTPATAAGTRPRKRLIAAGRLHPLKGFDLAIEALAYIDETIRPELVIVGSAPPDSTDYEALLHATIERLGLKGDVRLVGAKTRVPLAAALRESDIALMPSHSETFGLVTLEAAASGLPVIAYRSGGLRESVLDGKTGLLVGSRDPAEWGAAITRLITDEALTRRLGAAARRHALAMTWRASAEQLLEVYRALDSRGETSPNQRIHEFEAARE